MRVFILKISSGCLLTYSSCVFMSKTKQRKTEGPRFSLLLNDISLLEPFRNYVHDQKNINCLFNQGIPCRLFYHTFNIALNFFPSNNKSPSSAESLGVGHVNRDLSTLYRPEIWCIPKNDMICVPGGSCNWKCSKKWTMIIVPEQGRWNTCWYRFQAMYGTFHIEWEERKILITRR